MSVSLVSVPMSSRGGGKRAATRDPRFTSVAKAIVSIPAAAEGRGKLWAACRAACSIAAAAGLDVGAMVKGLKAEITAAGGNANSVSAYLSTIKNAVGSVRRIETQKVDEKTEKPLVNSDGKPVMAVTFEPVSADTRHLAVTLAEFADAELDMPYGELRKAMRKDSDVKRDRLIAALSGKLRNLFKADEQAFDDWMLANAGLAWNGSDVVSAETGETVSESDEAVAA